MGSLITTNSLSTSLDFADIIKASDVVVCGQATAEPCTLTEARVGQAGSLPPFTLVIGPVFSETFHLPRTAGISFRSYGVIGNAR